MKIGILVAICLIPLFTVSIFGQEPEVESLILKGDAFDYFGQPKNAFFFYDEALKKDPENEIAQKGKDEAYNQIKKIEDELEANLEWAESQNIVRISFSPGKSITFQKNDYVNWLKTQAYSNLGEYEKALSHSKKIREFPEDHYFIQILAPTLVKINADMKAIELIDDALTTYITHQGQAEKLGYYKVKALWKLGKYQGALDFAKGFTVDGGFIYSGGFREDAKANDRILTGFLYSAVGDLENAEHYYNLALNTGYRSIGFSVSEISYPITEEKINEGIIKFLFDVGEYQQAIPYIENLQNNVQKEEFLRAVEYDNTIHDTAYGDIVCGAGTMENEFGQCVPTSQSSGGCLIATATFGTELAHQVQMLREIRDNSLLQTQSGQSFMQGFNSFYYSFSPTIADMERENPVFKEAVKVTITPLLASLSLLNYVDLDSEESVLGYGIGIIMLNVGMYFVAPALMILGIYRKQARIEGV